MKTDLRRETKIVRSLRNRMTQSAILAGLAPLAGCARAPSFSILGSFFPAWLICMIIGVVLATVARWVLIRYNLEKDLAWKIVVYPCLAAFFAFTLWLVFFD